MKLILLVYVIFLSTFSFSQDMILLNRNKQKTFKTGSFVRIVLPSKNIEPCDACEGNYVVGNIVSYLNGILTLDVIQSGSLVVEGGKQIAFSDTRYTFKEGENRIDIPEQEILSVAHQGKKKYKRTSTGQAIGFVAIILGVGHLTAVPFADENRDVLAVLGLSELALGIVFASSLDYKEYITSVDCPSASPFPEKIWKLK
jgi:hypothetical protein